MSDIVWEDPPHSDQAGRGPTSKAARFLSELAQRPGKWAVYGTGYSQSNAAFNLKARATKLGYAVETTSRRTPEGFCVYARVIDPEHAA